jgi:DNA-binding protein Fis
MQNQNNAIAESNAINSKILQDDVKNKLSQWYVQRHGVHTDGNVHEMATLIQVSHNFLLFTVQPYSSR